MNRTCIEPISSFFFIKYHQICAFVLIFDFFLFQAVTFFWRKWRKLLQFRFGFFFSSFCQFFFFTNGDVGLVFIFLTESDICQSLYNHLLCYSCWCAKRRWILPCFVKIAACDLNLLYFFYLLDYFLSPFVYKLGHWFFMVWTIFQKLLFVPW